ncbi:hypothetical protein RRG08_052877 [Elysia crispata]|uniref:Fibronectin type-III domain-containing protein n=1 Tax=Elysia crispata TaxID=231223 RepID=A0AAE1DEQ0_9GAST|nr:hypothetical protein RRG08_052877 [Elysia crispata]
MYRISNIDSHVSTESVPARPRGLRADADHNGITVSWLRPRGGVPVKGYIVAYNPARDPQFVERVRVAGTTSKVRLDKVKPLTEYILSVRAFNKFGESRAYRVKATTPSFAPSTVRHAQTLPVSPTEIHLKWEAPSGGHVTRYHIRYWRPGRREKQSAWMTGNFRNYVAGSLRKGSNYRFEIIPYNGAIPGAAVVMFASTPGDTPDGPPLDISLEAVNSSTLLASWQPPDQDLANGKVKGYRLVLKVKGGKRIYSFRLHGSRRNFTFYDMDTSMTHQLKIGAITVNGTGVMSPWIDSTYFGNPDRPGSPQNLVIEPNVTTIQMSWSRPQFTGSRVTGYIVGYGRFIPEVYRVVLPGTQESYRITGLSPNSRYIVSVRTFNIIGESQPSFRRVSTLKVPPVRAPLLAPSKLTVQSDSPTSLVVTWVDPAIVDKKQMLDGRRYLIRYSPMSGESYIYVEASNQTFRLADLDPATSYELSVKTLRGNSSSKWSLPIVDSTQQTIPSSAPWNVTVVQSGGNPTVLHLRWMKPEQPNGKIEEYFVYQSVNPFLNSKLWNVTATNQLEMKLREVIPYRTYYFRLQARNRVGYGPLSEVIVFKPKTDSRAVPSNVAVSNLGGNGSAAKVKVTWEPLKINTEGILGYVIQYFNLSSVGGRQHWEVVNSERELVGEVSGLRFGTTYSFKVCASFFTGRGLCSGIVNFTIPHSVFQTNDRPDAQNTTSQPRTRDYSLSTTEPSITSTDRPSRVWPLSTAQIPHLVLTSAGTQHQEKEDGQDAERILEKREMEGEMEKNETDADGKVENQEDDNASKDSEDVEILEKVTTKSSKYDVRDILPTNQSDTISNYEGGHNKSNVTKGGNVELYPEYKKSGTGHSHSLERQTTVFGKYAKTTDSVHDESERSNVKNVSEHFGNIRSFPVERDKNTSSFPFEDQDLDPEGSEVEYSIAVHCPRFRQNHIITEVVAFRTSRYRAY